MLVVQIFEIITDKFNVDRKYTRVLSSFHTANNKLLAIISINIVFKVAGNKNVPSKEADRCMKTF
jgi:hypothetical protein